MRLPRIMCVVLGALPFAQTFSAGWTWNSRTATTSPTPRASSCTKSWGFAAPAGAPSPRTWPAMARASTALGASKPAVDVGDVKRSLSTARDRLEKNRQLFDEAKLVGELEYLEGVSSEAEFWNDATSARKTLGDLNRSVRSSRCVAGGVLRVDGKFFLLHDGIDVDRCPNHLGFDNIKICVQGTTCRVHCRSTALYPCICCRLMPSHISIEGRSHQGVCRSKNRAIFDGLSHCTLMCNACYRQMQLHADHDRLFSQPHVSLVQVEVTI
ncbi:unnamed protein product, partial [Scytosiphon promiscuus]